MKFAILITLTLAISVTSGWADKEESEQESFQDASSSEEEDEDASSLSSKSINDIKQKAVVANQYASNYQQQVQLESGPPSRGYQGAGSNGYQGAHSGFQVPSFGQLNSFNNIPRKDFNAYTGDEYGYQSSFDGLANTGSDSLFNFGSLFGPTSSVGVNANTGSLFGSGARPPPLPSLGSVGYKGSLNGIGNTGSLFGTGSSGSLFGSNYKSGQTNSYSDVNSKADIGSYQTNYKFNPSNQGLFTAQSDSGSRSSGLYSPGSFSSNVEIDQLLEKVKRQKTINDAAAIGGIGGGGSVGAIDWRSMFSGGNKIDWRSIFGGGNKIDGLGKNIYSGIGAKNDFGNKFDYSGSLGKMFGKKSQVGISKNGVNGNGQTRSFNDLLNYYNKQKNGAQINAYKGYKNLETANNGLYGQINQFGTDNLYGCPGGRCPGSPNPRPNCNGNDSFVVIMVIFMLVIFSVLGNGGNCGPQEMAELINIFITMLIAFAGGNISSMDDTIGLICRTYQQIRGRLL